MRFGEPTSIKFHSKINMTMNKVTPRVFNLGVDDEGKLEATWLLKWHGT